MSHDAAHPAEHLADDVRSIRTRGYLAAGALGITALLHVYELPVRFWQWMLLEGFRSGSVPAMSDLALSDSLVNVVAVSTIPLLLVTAILFLRWAHGLVRVTRALGATLQWQPGDVISGFVIPIVSIKRPYDIMRDVHEALTPDLVPEPTPVVAADEIGGYRNVEIKMPPPPGRIPNASIGAWWGAFWVANILGRIAMQSAGTAQPDADTLIWANSVQMVAAVADVFSAVLAVVLVRGLTARLDERFRRVRHSSVETLKQYGIIVG